MGRLVKRFGRLVPGQVVDARAEAAAILLAARDEANRLMDEARGAAAVIREEARQAGLTEGRQAAETAFTSLLLAARADAERVRAAALPGARALAARMAEKIVGRAVDLDRAALDHIVAVALNAARARTGLVTLRVHPDDLAALEKARPAMVARLGAAAELRMVADAAVGRAGCVVETPAGRVDARLSTQLLALERAVFGDHPSPPGGALGG